MPWTALKSWSEDISVLEPLGFQRGIFRTEINAVSGQPVLMDLFTPINVSSYHKTVHIPVNGGACAHSRFTENWHVAGTSNSTKSTSSEEGCHHTDYVQMVEPYQGLWIATHDTLTAFMQSKWWNEETALKATIPSGIKSFGGYAERSTWGVQLFRIPEGFDTAMVVPYSPVSIKLSRLAEVKHLRNGYSSRNNSPHSNYWLMTFCFSRS